jgi:hypothetical protein
VCPVAAGKEYPKIEDLRGSGIQGVRIHSDGEESVVASATRSAAGIRLQPYACDGDLLVARRNREFESCFLCHGTTVEAGEDKAVRLSSPADFAVTWKPDEVELAAWSSCGIDAHVRTGKRPSSVCADGEDAPFSYEASSGETVIALPGHGETHVIIGL